MILGTLRDELHLELVATYLALGQAKTAQAEKDTPVNRLAVADAYQCIDALLDLMNDSR